jgi:hypothetical protein
MTERMAVNDGLAVNSYRDAVLALTQRLSTAGTALKALFQAADPNDAAWLAAMGRETAALRSVYLDAIALVPPGMAQGWVLRGSRAVDPLLIGSERQTPPSAGR